MRRLIAATLLALGLALGGARVIAQEPYDGCTATLQRRLAHFGWLLAEDFINQWVADWMTEVAYDDWWNCQ